MTTTTTPPTKRQQTAQDKQERADWLRERLPPGSTLYTVLRGEPSRSGMSRTIGLILLTESGPLHPNYAAALLLGLRLNPTKDGITLGGCGMDMGLHLVSSLSRVLYPDGFGCTGEGCPSNDHSNGDRDTTPHGQERPAACARCRGDGTITRFGLGPDSEREPCAWCAGTGRTPDRMAHWHRSGDYAIRHRWL
jgi:hypothetical protein